MNVKLLNYLYLILGVVVILWASIRVWQTSTSKDKNGKTHFQRNKRKDNVLKYLWRKHYRAGILIVSVAISLFIVFADKIFKIDNIPAKDELSAVLLLFTAAIVFWYTRETYDLKQITQDAKKIQQKQYDNETLPFLRLQWSSEAPDVFHIKNEGRGIATDVAFETINIQRTPRIPVVIKKRPVLAPGGWSAIKEDELKEAPEILSSLNMRGFIDARLKSGNFKTLHVSYMDLRGRIFDAEFEPDETYNDRFRILFQKQRKNEDDKVR